jgi:HNH endonuclease
MSRFSISTALRESVRNRAFCCCEYCKSQDKYSPTNFTIDHIVPQSNDGGSELDNLAYACFLCNRLKSNKTKAFDVNTSTWIPIFNPRKNDWDEHFTWSDDALLIIGKTSIARATVSELQLNRSKLIEYRQSLIQFNRHPPIIQ